jgi:hypothetical protein
MTDDRGLAALAAALHPHICGPVVHVCGNAAAAILGERGVFLPDGHPLGVEEAIAQGQARIAALDARIVDLNAEVLDRMDQWHRDSLARDELARQQNRKIAALRAALDLVVAAAEAVQECCAVEESWGGPEQCAYHITLRAAFRAALATAKDVR